MPACEYCGEHYPKGGAHATHVRNCDERPQPDGGDLANEGEQTETDTGDSSGLEPSDNTIQMSEEEFSEMLTSVEEQARASGREEGIERGYDAGLTEAQQQADQTATQSTETDSAPSRPSQCPECGDALLDGDSIADDLQAYAQEDKGVAKFLAANEGADPDYACRNVRKCGYYVEDGEAKTFENPGGGGLFGLVMVGLAAIVALVLGAAGAAKNQNQSQHGPQFDDDWRTF